MKSKGITKILVIPLFSMVRKVKVLENLENKGLLLEVIEFPFF
jgi:hypothetical protein